MIRSLTRPATTSLVVPVIFFAMLTALTARIVIHLPFTVIPITLQTLAVLLSGLVLGSRGGAYSQLLYIAALAAGLPMSSSGIGGPAVFLTPTAGYIVAFVPGAFIAGYLLEARPVAARHALILHVLAGIAGMIVIYVGGIAWLTVLTGSVSIALQQGLFPFIGVDLAKATVAALAAGGGRLIFSPNAQ
jgi:biotin transport system substrate-specific component